MSTNAGGRMRRWQEQRWILDAVIRTVGVEWDQGRLRYGAAPGGSQAAGEFRTVGSKIKRVGDFVREFSNAATRREKKAAAAGGAPGASPRGPHSGCASRGRPSRRTWTLAAYT